MTIKQSGYTASTEDARGHITCTICQAVYAPMPAFDFLLEAPPLALESALMSMCHFCFRCRRPACPQCWDELHGICGACTQETNLSFRCPSAPLNGTLLPLAPPSRSLIAPPSASLICIRPGCFQPASPEEGTPSAPASSDQAVAAFDPPLEQSARYTVSIGRSIERILTVVALLTLLFVLLLIILAVLSSRANALILVFFHVDIRDEIAYLWLLVKSLR